MIFQFTWEKVLSGEKTQTRRLSTHHSGSYADGAWFAVYNTLTGYPVWQVGRDYAVCPGRGKAQVARIEITQIREEDVRNVSWQDACAEGFSGAFEFLRVWTMMHDKTAARAWDKTDFSDGDESGYMGQGEGWMSWLKGQRPAKFYSAWALTFRLVE